MLAALILPAMGSLSINQTQYLAGLHDGLILGQLEWQSRGNQTASDQFNASVDLINAALLKHGNSTDLKPFLLVHVRPLVTQSDLPAILQVNQTTGKWLV
jgi:hypothetical protein